MACPRWLLLSELLLHEASGKPMILHLPLSGQKWSFTGSLLTLRTSLLIALMSPIVGDAEADAHRENG